MYAATVQGAGSLAPPRSVPSGRSIRALLGIMVLTLMTLPRLHELVPYAVHFEVGKLAILLCVVTVLTAKPPVRVPWNRLPQVRLYILFTVWLFLSAALGVWPGSSLMAGVTFLKNLLFVFLFLKSVDTMEDCHRVIRVLLFGMLVFSSFIVLRASLGRADTGGYTLDANESALLISVTMPFYYGYFKKSRGLLRVVFLGGMVLGTAGVLFSGSRGGVLSLCCVMAYAYFTDRGMLLKKVALIVLTVMAVLVFMPDGIRERFDKMGDPEQDYNMTSRYGRMMIWERAFSVIAENPVVGVGLGNFIFIESEVNNDSRGKVAHNFLLQLATEMGIPGALLMLLLFYVSWRQVRRLRKSLYGRPDMASAHVVLAGLEAGWVAFFIGGQFLSVGFSAQILFLASCSALSRKCLLRGDFMLPRTASGNAAEPSAAPAGGRHA